MKQHDCHHMIGTRTSIGVLNWTWLSPQGFNPTQRIKEWQESEKQSFPQKNTLIGYAVLNSQP